MILSASVVVAFAVQLALCWAANASDDEPVHIPAYLTIVAPLVVVVAARRGFADIGPSMPIDQLVERLHAVASVGPWMCLLGVTGIVGGLWPRRRGRDHGAPSMVQTGALTLGAGLMWGPLLSGVAALWATWDQPTDVLNHLSHCRQAAWPWVAGGLLVVAVGWGASSVWGYRRYRWNGLGEGLAAGALVALVLSTGRPAASAIASVAEPMRAACDRLDTIGVDVPGGTHAPVHAAIARQGPRQLEQWTPQGWQPWSPTEPLRVLWVASPTQTLGQVGDQLAILPPGTEVLLAGRGRSNPVEGPLFARHPVVASRRCRAWPWPVAGTRGTLLGDALSDGP